MYLTCQLDHRNGKNYVYLTRLVRFWKNSWIFQFYYFMQTKPNSDPDLHQHIKWDPDPFQFVPVPDRYATLFLSGWTRFHSLKPVLRIRIRMDPHLKNPPGSGSGSAWTDANPDPGGKKSLENVHELFMRWIQNRKIKSKYSFVMLKVMFCLLIFNDFLM